MYNTSITMLNQEEKVTVNFKDTPLDEVLSFLLNGKNLAWTYSDDVVVIHKRMGEGPKKTETAEDSTVTPSLLTGKVTDAVGSPLSGVTILVKGSNQGTTTDMDGKFTLAKVANGEMLIVSSVGFETRSLVVRGRSVLVQLNVEVSALDEKVVIAYGTTTQRLSTGNISTVKAKDIERQPVNNPLLALQGRVPGLFITQNTGVAGGSATVRIQGQNSIANGNDPLYVIDGVPYPAQMIGVGSENIILGGNPLNFINTSDIESIDILKDADATSIYGSRAANGAILITTKKGKVGQTKVNINLQQGWSKVTRGIDMLDTRQYLDMRYEAYRNDNVDWKSSDVTANDLKLWDTTRYTNWQKTLIGGTAQYTNINVGISGGTTASQYTVGGTYHRETTVFPGNFADQRGSLHFNLSSKSINQKIQLQLSGNYMVDNNKLPRSDLTSRAVLYEPNAPALYNTDGSLNWALNPSGVATWENPLIYQLYSTYSNKTNNLVGSATLSYTILPGLDIKSSAGYTNMQTTTFTPIPLGAIAPQRRASTPRTATYGNRSMTSWIIEPQLAYQKNIGKGNFELLLGASIQQNNSSSQTINGSGYSSDLVLGDIKSAVSIRPEYSASIYKYNALFSRINYNFQNKYIINATARRDGSSRFGEKNRLHNFGSLGIAWIFTEEKFLDKSLSTFSFGKLRASYGITGNDQLGDYRFLGLYYSTGLDILPYQNTIGLATTSLPNPYLQWEKTKKLSLGIDLGFWNDRLILTTTYSDNRSSNQLLPYMLPSITGFSSITSNFPATIKNVSWEFLMTTVNIKSNTLSWNSSINLTIPRNKLISFPNLEQSTYANRLIIGQPLGVTKTFHFVGVDPASGLYQVADSHGKPTTSPDYLTDLTTLISTLPTFYGGVQNNITYKGIQLDFMIQFVKQKGRNILFNNDRLAPGEFSRGSSNQPTTVLERWQKPGDITSIQRYSIESDALATIYNATDSDAAYSDASYLRLKNLSLSWQLPDKWLKKASFHNSRIYMQGQNLLTITKYKGLDPENRSITSLPPLRVISFGVQVEL